MKKDCGRLRHPAIVNTGSFSITTTGWYTFEHHFYNVGLGVLAVDLRISTLNGVPLHTWTLSDPTDLIGSTVGDHRYGWLVIQEFPVLAIDQRESVESQRGRQRERLQE